MNPMQPENASSHIIIQNYTGTTVSNQANIGYHIMLFYESPPQILVKLLLGFSVMKITNLS